MKQAARRTPNTAMVSVAVLWEPGDLDSGYGDLSRSVQQCSYRAYRGSEPSSSYMQAHCEKPVWALRHSSTYRALPSAVTPAYFSARPSRAAGKHQKQHLKNVLFSGEPPRCVQREAALDVVGCIFKASDPAGLVCPPTMEAGG